VAIFTEITTDNVYTSNEAYGSEFWKLDYLPIEPTYNQLDGLWSGFYSSIALCNIILDKIDAIEMDETKKNYRKGEMKFLRAWAYFHLVRFFGGVPLTLSEMTTVDELYTLGRESVDNIYESIISDLNDAKELLPSIAERGRATKAAVLAMLCEIYLTKKDYSNAKTELGEIVKNASVYGLSLMGTYENIFDPESEANNTEVIFAVQYMSGGYGTGNDFMTYFLPHSSVSVALYNYSGGGGYCLVTQDLYDSFEQGDLRKDLIAKVEEKNVYYTTKYIDLTRSTGNSDLDNDWIVYRLADVKLMYAETLNETGNTQEALEQMNEIRRRAGLTDKAGLSKSEVTLAIEQERRAELNFEGHRWFDLIRTDRLLTVMNNYYEKEGIEQIEEYVDLFPIPETEILKNPDKLTQNPGY
jgi:hypothetical protein